MSNKTNKLLKSVEKTAEMTTYFRLMHATTAIISHEASYHR